MGVSTSTPFGIGLKAIVGALALQMLGDSKVLVSISTTQQVEEDTRYKIFTEAICIAKLRRLRVCGGILIS